MKFYQILISSLFSLTFVIICNAQVKKTTIKGTVSKWPTDTIYLQTLPFHSPHSAVLKYQLIFKDSTFNFQFEKADKPFVFFITPQRKIVDQQVKILLFNNLTEEHYWGNCIKIYTYGKTTNLIEPGEKLDINITWNGWTKTDVDYSGSGKFKNEYYQKSFDLDNKADKALSGITSENIAWAISNLKNAVKSQLEYLESNKDKLSPVFYDYIKAEIEFGAKKEFLKYLWSEKENYLKEIVASGKIPDTFVEILAFDKYSINDAGLISEEYNEFLEEYINFLTNISNREYKRFNPFNLKKLKIVAEEFPEKSIYHYVVNQLLLIDDESEFKGIIKKIIKYYPDGELNSKLKEKYKI